MQQLFNKVVMIALLVTASGAFGQNLKEDDAIKDAARTVFMKNLMYGNVPNKPDLYMDCYDNLIEIHVQAIYLGVANPSFEIARKEIADLATKEALKLHEKYKDGTSYGKEWTLEDIRALAHAITIRNLMLHCQKNEEGRYVFRQGDYFLGKRFF